MGLRLVREPAQIAAAISRCAPRFLCFEVDEPDARGINALSGIRRDYPGLPVLLLTSCISGDLARWAMHLRVWDLLVKPVPVAALRQHLEAFLELTRWHQALPSTAAQRQSRTHPAITHVAAQFHHKIALDHVAALCRLSPSQFCRVFRHEQGVSFCQYLLRYRIEQACERLAASDALAKEVAYSVGFNDLSYFTWAFKRQIGVCPSQYHSFAGKPIEAAKSS